MILVLASRRDMNHHPWGSRVHGFKPMPRQRLVKFQLAFRDVNDDNRKPQLFQIVFVLEAVIGGH